MKMLIVNCATCEVRGEACADCVISTLLGAPEAEAPPRLSGEEQRVLGLFAESGMLPPLRLVESRGAPFDQGGEVQPSDVDAIRHKRSG